MDILTGLAKSHNLQLQMCLSFPDFYMSRKDHPHYSNLLRYMNVLGRDGSFLSPEEQEVAELYVAFCFRKYE